MSDFNNEYLEKRLGQLSRKLDLLHNHVDPSQGTSDLDLTVLLLVEDMQSILDTIYKAPSP